MYLREKNPILWCPWNSIHNLWTYLPLGKGFRPWKCIKSLKSSSLTDWMVMMSMKPSSKIKNHDPWVMGTGPWAGCDTQVIVNACWPLATLKTIAQVLGYNFRSRRHQSTHLKSYCIKRSKSRLRRDWYSKYPNVKATLESRTPMV